MVIRNGEAETGVGLETSGRRQHVDGRRFERKIVGEHELAVIHAAFVRRAWRAANYIVPEKE